MVHERLDWLRELRERRYQERAAVTKPKPVTKVEVTKPVTEVVTKAVTKPANVTKGVDTVTKVMSGRNGRPPIGEVAMTVAERQRRCRARRRAAAVGALLFGMFLGHDLETVIVCDEHDETGTLRDVVDVCIGVDLR